METKLNDSVDLNKISVLKNDFSLTDLALKASKVVSSCENNEQLERAKSYFSNLEKYILSRSNSIESIETIKVIKGSIFEKENQLNVI